MKFLCVDCDEPMKIKKTEGPEEGSLTVIFGCPVCQRDIALLTNPWETQMLRSLDVKVGGKTVPAEPMSMVRATLVQKNEELLGTQKGPTLNEGKGSDPLAETKEENVSSCPFSQVVSEAFAKGSPSNGELTWSEGAEKRLERIPGFIRPMAKKGIEMYARERGYKEITETVMDEARGKFGM